MKTVRVFGLWTIARIRRLAAMVLVVALASVLGLACYHHVPLTISSVTSVGTTTAPAASGPSQQSPSPTPVASTAIVQIPHEKLASLRIETEPVQKSPRPRRLRVTGQLELNGSRIAHVNSQAEGVVREVCVEIGDTVVAQQVLAYIDSREVGEAKLALVRERLNLRAAEETCQWETAVHDNVMALLTAMQEGIDPEQIEQQFQDRPLGTYREQLVAALTRMKRAAADHQRVHALGQQGVLPGKQALHAQAEHEAAQAAYRALVEQIRFDAQQKLRVAQQRLKEAESAVAICRSQLLILGYDGPAIDAMDPIAEGERVAYYPVRAPFAGTVIAKPVLLSQHVDEATTLLEIADLSTVWLRADVFEKDLGAVAQLEGTSLTFRTPSYPEQDFTAKVFTVGHQVSDQTRAMRLLATADNPKRLLKPGMFVDVELDGGEEAAVLQIPVSAVQRHQGAVFSFVACGPGQFARRDVQLGPSTSERVEVKAGLDEGEQVVVQGGFALKSELFNDSVVE